MQIILQYMIHFGGGGAFLFRLRNFIQSRRSINFEIDNMEAVLLSGADNKIECAHATMGNVMGS